MLVGSAAAQDATPEATPGASPVATPIGEIVTGVLSISREDYLAALQEEFEFSEPEQTGGTVIYGETSDVESMNTLISSDVYTGRIGGLIHEYLVGTNVLDGTLVPGLADSWELAEDGLTYTFNLHPGVMWHDGTPFTAEDVAFSFDATLAEDTLSPRRSSVLQVLDTYRAVDENTFEMVANDFWATFLENTVGLVAIMPKHIWGDIPPADWGNAEASTGLNPELVVGTGPMLFQERVIGENVTLTKNAEYWDESQVLNIDTFIFRVIGEDAAALQALETGELDFTDVPFADAPNLEQNPDLTVRAYDTTSFNYFSTNHKNPETPFFDEIPVRQALMYALDRELLAEEVYNGYAIQADGTQPVLSVAYAPDRTNSVYGFDPDMARQLLEEAGWVDEDGDGIREKDGVPMTFEVLYTEGVATYTQQLPYMQEAWREVGLDPVLRAVPFQTLLDTVDAYEHQMVVWGFNWSVDGGQGVMFRCDALRPQGFNSFEYCNPEYDDIDTQAEKTLDPDARVDLLIEASNIVNDEAVAGILVFRQTTTGIRNSLHNFYPNGYAYLWSLPWVWTEVQD
jgi:peptide/nickel transport system substrate-binding protein